MPRRDSPRAASRKAATARSPRSPGRHFVHLFRVRPKSSNSSGVTHSTGSSRRKRHHQGSPTNSHNSKERDGYRKCRDDHWEKHTSASDQPSRDCVVCGITILGVAFSYAAVPWRSLCLNCYHKTGKGSSEDHHIFIALKHDEVCPGGMVAIKIDGKYYPIPHAYITELGRFKNAKSGAYVGIKLPSACEKACIPVMTKYLLNYFWFRSGNIPQLSPRNRSRIPEIRTMDKDPRRAYFRTSVLLWRIGSQEQIPELQREAERMLTMRQIIREDPIAILEQIYELDSGRSGHGLRAWARSLMAKRHNAMVLIGEEWQGRWLDFIEKYPAQVAIALAGQ